jgi:hypothetical protein
MSALPPKADIAEKQLDVRFVPRSGRAPGSTPAPGEVARTASPTFGLSLRWSTPGSKPASPLAPCDGDHDQSRHKHDENKQA